MNFRNWTAALAGTVALCLAGVAKADETSLIFATTDPGTIALNVQLLHPWADRVNEQGKGFVHIDVRDGSALADHTNFYDRVQDDVIQVGFGQLAYIGGKFPRSAILTLPFVAETSSEVASVAFWRLYKSGLVNAEYDSIVPILFASLPPAGLHLAKPAATLDNLNGLKITIVAKAMGEAVSRLGGTPLSIAAPDIYEAIQRGTANGAVMTWNGLTTFKLQEVTTYHVETSLGATLAVLLHGQEALRRAARRGAEDHRCQFRRGRKPACRHLLRQHPGRRPRSREGGRRPADRQSQPATGGLVARAHRAGDRGLGQGDAGWR